MSRARKFKSMVGHNWGLKGKIQKTIYLIEKIILYASSFWSFPMTTRKISQLQRIQRFFLLQITRSFKTTSTQSLCTLSGIPPLFLQATKETLKTNLLQLKKEIKIQDEQINPKLIEHKASKDLLHPAIRNKGIKIYNTANSEEIPKQHLFTQKIYFTDGSKLNGNTGAAFVHFQNQQHIRTNTFLLHPYNTVFQAEAYDILKAIEHNLPTRVHLRSQPYL